MTERKQDRRRERTAAAILTAASRLFFERGVAQTTTDDIAAWAGVSVGSIYAHFGDKQTLFVTLCEQALALNERYIANRAWSASPMQRLQNTGDAYLRFALDHTEAFYLTTMRVRQASDSETIQALEVQMTERITRIAGQIGADAAAAIDAGEIDPVPIPQLLMYLWGSWAGVISLHLRVDEFKADDYDVTGSLALGTQIIGRGLGLAGPSGDQATAPPR